MNLFDEAYKKLNKETEANGSETTETCFHDDIMEESGAKSCLKCGREVRKDILFEKEWRYYGVNDTKHTDPNRCHIRKTEDKNIFSDVAGFGFTDKIVTSANVIYNDVTGGNIKRANFRKAIVFGCIFQAYKLDGHPQNCADLMTVFKIERKVALKGLKHISRYAPKGSPIRDTYTTPDDFVTPLMRKLNATKEEIDEVIKMCKSIKNKSSVLNRSRPQSVSAGLVYYYCLLKNKSITIKKFIEIAELSELTVNKIAKEISRIRGTEDII